MKAPKHSLHAIAWLIALTLVSCNLGRKETTQAPGIRVVELTRDSMLYGLCLDVNAGDSLHFISDMGDTLWYALSPDLRVVGRLTPGEQLAVMLGTTQRRQQVTLAINTSMLIGEWVEDDPIAEGNVKGYLIGNGGAAEGINLTDTRIEGWSIYNGRLLLSGGFGVEEFTDTFAVTLLTADSLRLVGRAESHFFHRLRPGEANYENAAYDFDADPTAGMDFNPESQDVEVSPEILGDGPVY